MGGHDVVHILKVVLALLVLGAVLPWFMYEVIRRPLFAAHTAYGMERWADSLRKQSERAWRTRPRLISQLTSLVIGSGGGSIGLFIIGLNVLLLSRIFDFLGLSGLNTFEPNLPFVGSLGEEIGIVSLIIAAIFAAVECALGIVLFYLWPAPLNLLPSRNQTELPMTRASRNLAITVGCILAIAIAFEAILNYIQVTTLQDPGDAARSWLGLSAAFIGVIVPTTEAVLAGFAWHAAAVPLSEWALAALSALYFRLAAGTLSRMSYPHSEIRLCSRTAGELDSLGAELREQFRHLRDTCQKALNLPPIRNNPEMKQRLQSIVADLRNV